ncbi:hypothetical protein [Halorussus sp. AFM4]|uniref:hypothetical protein n=1 Tax=Halorussus sp. AFM4 TaxID=3421651 RepID=UPI003EB96226
MPTRRRLLAALPSVALAGCLGRATGPDGSDTTDGTPAATTTDPATTSFPGDLVRRNGRTVVDFPALSDGEVSVESSPGVATIAFSGSVDADFELAVAVDGEMAGEGSPIAASRTLTPADEPRAFVAPVYRSAEEGFEFRAYANTAFRELGDLHLLAAPGRSLAADGAASRPAEFESLTETVGRTTVSAADVEGADAGAPLSVGLLDASLEAIRSGDASSVSGVVLQYVQGVQQQSSPKAVFEFEFDNDSVTVTHRGGDGIAGANLAVRVGGEPAAVAFPEEVTAGDSVTVDLSGVAAGTSVRVVWTAPERDRAAVLGAATVPRDGTTAAE